MIRKTEYYSEAATHADGWAQQHAACDCWQARTTLVDAVVARGRAQGIMQRIRVRIIVYHIIQLYKHTASCSAPPPPRWDVSVAPSALHLGDGVGRRFPNPHEVVAKHVLEDGLRAVGGTERTWHGWTRRGRSARLPGSLPAGSDFHRIKPRPNKGCPRMSDTPEPCS